MSERDEIDNLRAERDRLAADVAMLRVLARQSVNARVFEYSGGCACVELDDGLPVAVFMFPGDDGQPAWNGPPVERTANPVAAAFQRADQWNALLARLRDTQPCGHPRSTIGSSDEGTHWCGDCEREGRADERDDQRA